MCSVDDLGSTEEERSSLERLVASVLMARHSSICEFILQEPRLSGGRERGGRQGRAVRQEDCTMQLVGGAELPGDLWKELW